MSQTKDEYIAQWDLAHKKDYEPLMQCLLL